MIVPIYNHGDTIGAVLRGLTGLDVPCLVVDDGSDERTRSTLRELAEVLPWVRLHRLPTNRGRGAALRRGYELAAESGFSHAVQLDADGQHDPADVPKFLEAARRNRHALVLGAPIFDVSAPRSRLYGRRLSQAIVWMETLCFDVRDPLCGFRCFPLESTMRLIRRVRFGDRMEFDPEIVVRLVWDGVPVVNVPTRVRYFPGALSHFDFVNDNLRMARTYGRLFVGLLPRVPSLLVRGRARVA